MIKKLIEIEALLPALLEDPLGWQSLLIDYETPHVWRLWRQFDTDTRLFLHKIFPCDVALLHPHPWPSAVRVFTPGSVIYETAVGRGVPEATAPPTPATFMLKDGSAYEMVDPFGWHYVRPIGGPIYSVMVTGKPYTGVLKQPRFGQGQKHGALNAFQISGLLTHFGLRYPKD
jgi:hypothetical protein